MLMDSQGSQADPDFPVPQLDLTFPDLWETRAFLDWTENMVSKVLQVLPAHRVQARPRETEETPDCQVFLVLLAGRESPDSPEAPDHPAVPVSKVSEERRASAEVQVSKGSPVILVTKEDEGPKDSEGLLGVRASRASPCR